MACRNEPGPESSVLVTMKSPRRARSIVEDPEYGGRLEVDHAAGRVRECEVDGLEAAGLMRVDDRDRERLRGDTPGLNVQLARSGCVILSRVGRAVGVAN